MRKEKLDNWVARVAGENKDFDDIHFDELAETERKNVSGIDLVILACNIITSSLSALRRTEINHGIKNISIYFPVSVSNEIIIWNYDIWNNLGDPEIWKSLGIIQEPPSIYLSRVAQTFNDECEEYRRKISLPIHTEIPTRAVFRSSGSPATNNEEAEFFSTITITADVT